MKKKIPILMLGIALMLASCSQDEDALQTGSGEPITVTFTATPDGSMTQRAMKTRAVEDPTDEPIARAVLEIYDGNNLVGDRINGVIDGDNITFTAKLEENKTYTCLFWADEGEKNGEGGVKNYDITDLRAIKRENTWRPSIAYYASKTITASTRPEPVTLTHAVSKVVLHETGALSAGDKVRIYFLTPEYTFNVEDGSFDTDGESYINSRADLEIGEETSGQLGSLYVFAPADGYLTWVTLAYTPSDGNQRTTQIPNVPLKMNHRTVLKGEFAKIGLQNFNITLDKNWDGDISDIPTASVGDYYYEGERFSDTYNSSLNCLGIVFYTENDGRNGKVVSLQERSSVSWGESITTNATDMSNGLANMATIYALSNDFTGYPAFKWIHDDMNGGGTTNYYSDATAKGVWYLPAHDELLALHTAYHADRTTFNDKLTTAGSTALGGDYYYWSSSEYDENNARSVYSPVASVGPSEGYLQKSVGNDNRRARCILAF